MNYEERYNQALERAKEFMTNKGVAPNADAFKTAKELTETIFPELCESEDERIRKSLIKGFQHYDKECKWGEFTTTEILSWLEKQDEQKHTDKVESKFKVGDWITNGGLLVGQVTSFDGEYYHYMCEGIEQPLHISNVYNWHLWTIQDAKDGDVLANGDVDIVLIFKCFAEPSYRQHIIAHIGLDASGDIQVTDGYWNLGFDCGKPATKEQYDLLFQKMKEAGYEWDAEKKELKEIEQKTDWSEEDENHLKNCIAYFGTIEKTSPFYGDYLWLKSLKPQNKWKPSEEQMEALFEAKLASTKNREYFLGLLYEDLKKL